jgi:hypothetical protein
MKLNYFIKQLSTVGRSLVKTLFCLAAIALMWEGAFLATAPAMADTANSILVADLGDRIQQKASQDAGRTKSFIQKTAEQVEKTANKNTERVKQATDDDNNFLERRAKRDRDIVEKRAKEDAAQTQKAVDTTKNAIERTVENIKDTFSK